MTTVLRRVRSGQTYAGQMDITILVCSECSIAYGIPEKMRSQAQARGHFEIHWHCPNGHNQGYDGDSEVEKLKAQRDRATRRADANADLLNHTERRLAAQKGATTKAKKRHAAGVCPCCNRSFSQLKRHMSAKHAEYLEQHGLPVGEVKAGEDV